MKHALSQILIRQFNERYLCTERAVHMSLVVLVIVW